MLQSSRSFSKQEAIKTGWNLVKENFLLISGVWGIVFVIYFVSQALAKSFNDTAPFLSFLVFVLAWVVQLVILLGSIKIALKLVEDKKPKFSDLYAHYALLFSFLIGTFLYVSIVSVGTILFIIPGIIWAIQFRFFPFAIVEKKATAFGAFEISSKITQGVKWNLFLFFLLLGVIVMFSALAFGVGVLITIPLSIVATASVYRKLSS
ncbi:MAG: hypothetical protein A3F31_00410 [Candidatus Levybacteria bacterium RIFCSPHIGHO2_12_FULL_38_12]|nr:MAG: hypothetical protein A2770_03480 [Candidatus Levybacteria bacterium RIFCSPHIGHO2_01_FULL_38_12]OGH23221.1 MAG: hypothetical protein A3F31_00410 [Candidatus Levybacteria bacterium RIFCSPHIGHO2_12_FULL_38_12]OGH34499.1 MAG: hypothetical protein A3A47_00930 [Candidatus Levybacteria bacterium RIFCSPLOWO2_01_FULL_37_20]OGH44747.1 MAG: hypothetical protein A3J14_00290 [Candidatus Levybacteria bacterium RIFCSPLOWO2_02_FULL_37_18]